MAVANELTLEQSRISYVDIPAILAGAVLALAISLVLMNFGTAIGFAIPQTYQWKGETGNAWAGVVVIGLWAIWTQMLASFAGGYLAGRMRRPVAGSTDHEREIRDGAHGLLAWATGTVCVAIAVGLTGAITAVINGPESAPVVDTATASAVMERNAAIIFAFVTSASALVSAVASWWAATMGGDHRDNAVDHSHYISFRKK